MSYSAIVYPAETLKAMYSVVEALTDTTLQNLGKPSDTNNIKTILVLYLSGTSVKNKI